MTKTQALENLNKPVFYYGDDGHYHNGTLTEIHVEDCTVVVEDAVTKLPHQCDLSRVHEGLLEQSTCEALDLFDESDPEEDKLVTVADEVDVEDFDPSDTERLAAEGAQFGLTDMDYDNADVLEKDYLDDDR